ncbi:uncharacterized protein LOC121378317 [Gigantopelta aegis]|uniref:uncharacterized protein LOC121378317 n=1 Tax=Gigantopelta aegis TaxID=1735272 RepID=UPI001B88AA38|nr:uncharacterized protein LOC121378317 [Gigantopelta aegis]
MDIQLSVLLVFISCLIDKALAIDCYVCTSVDEDNKACIDPFDLGLDTYHLIERNCMYGYFRGTHCIKLTGQREDGSKLLVRLCSDRDWGRHCGDIRYEYGTVNEKMYGCLETCDEDGCNGTAVVNLSFSLVIAMTVLWHVMCR